MKKGKMILAALAFIVALGGAFAFKGNAKFNIANVFYYVPGEAGYYKTSCQTTDNLLSHCLTIPSGADKYYALIGTTYNFLPPSTVTYAVNGQ